MDEIDSENAATAHECFQELFSAYPGFADDDAAESFLRTTKTPNDPLVLNKLLKYIRNILRMFVSDGESTLTLGSNTAEGLVEKFLPFTRKVRFGFFNGTDLNFSPWPLVRLVWVKLSSPILSQGIILADLPGASDVNRFRVDAANRYMQTCDITIVFAKIDRPERSLYLEKQYMDAYCRRRSESVIIVLTRSDDLNTNGKTNIDSESHDEERLHITRKCAALDKRIRDNKLAMDNNRSLGETSLNKQLWRRNKKLSYVTHQLFLCNHLTSTLEAKKEAASTRVRSSNSASMDLL
jgi:hypothetical protein